MKEEQIKEQIEAIKNVSSEIKTKEEALKFLADAGIKKEVTPIKK